LIVGDLLVEAPSSSELELEEEEEEEEACLLFLLRLRFFGASRELVVGGIFGWWQLRLTRDE
jgi:hypothetical protein